MKILYSPQCLEHGARNGSCYPENAERLRQIYDLLGDQKQAISLVNAGVDGEQYLSLAHDERYILKIMRLCESLEDGLFNDEKRGIVFSKASYDAACEAVSCSLAAANETLEHKSAFALVRPPGHHAGRTYGSDFCIFNNAAIAALYLLHEHRKRVLVVDFDLHHCDGTQDIVESVLQDNPDSGLRLFSVHSSNVCSPKGLRSIDGVTNIAIHQKSNDSIYLGVINSFLVPLLESYDPEVIVVSAGFDCFTHYTEAEQDNLPGHRLERGAFLISNHSLERLKSVLDNYPCCYVLEGGYNPFDIAKCLDIFCGTRLYPRMRSKRYK